MKLKETDKQAAIQESETREGVLFLHLFDDGELISTESFTDFAEAKRIAILWVSPEDYDNMH